MLTFKLFNLLELNKKIRNKNLFDPSNICDQIRFFYPKNSVYTSFFYILEIERKYYIFAIIIFISNELKITGFYRQDTKT